MVILLFFYHAYSIQKYNVSFKIKNVHTVEVGLQYPLFVDPTSAEPGYDQGGRNTSIFKV